MKIIYIGCVEFSKIMLEKLISLNADIVGVVTKQESSFNSDFCDLTPLCKKYHIKSHYTKNVNSEETLSWIKALNPDIIFCFGWSNLIKKELLNIPPLGIVGYHPAYLPANRGRHPIIWALALGLKESASTFFFMEEGADDGDILSQVPFPIHHDDDASTIIEKLKDIAAAQIEEFYFDLLNKQYKRVKQDHSKANVWRKRGIKDGIIDFRMNSQTIYNLVRALTKPYVGASIIYNDEEIKIWKINIIDCNKDNIEYGKVLDIKNSVITVKTADGAIELIDHSFKTLPKVGEYL